jgi:hypothetical protein
LARIFVPSVDAPKVSWSLLLMPSRRPHRAMRSRVYSGCPLSRKRPGAQVFSIPRDYFSNSLFLLLVCHLVTLLKRFQQPAESGHCLCK